MNQGFVVSISKLCAAIASFVSLGLAISASGANLVSNGDFANVGNVFVATNSFGSDDIQTPGSTDIPGWTNVAKFVNEAWIEPDNLYGLTASPGNGSGYFVDLTGQGNSKPYGGLEQKITTVPGMGYTLTFALGSSTSYNSSGTGAAALTASATGSAVLTSHLFSLVPTSSNDWATETLTFIADSDSTTIEFLGDSSNTSRYIGLDNVVMETRLLATSIKLTASPTTAVAGTSVSLTALVKPSEGSVTPSGKVEFKNGGHVLATVTLNGTGQATYSTSALAVGKDSVTAVYMGDSIHSTSTSAAESVTITAGGPAVTVSASSLAFGSQPIGTSSAAKSVTITNSGTAAVTFTSIKLTGGQADDYALSKTCGSSLAVKAACAVSVTFKPVSTGSKIASISIADNSTGSPQTVAVGGTGVTGSSGPIISLSTTALTFGDQSSGTTSSAKSVTLTNSGTASLSLSSIALAGSQADDFTLTKTCGSSLAAKASCTVSVTFKPVSAGAKSASISIADSASDSPQTVRLSGTGTTAGSTSTNQLEPDLVGVRQSKGR